MRQINPNLDKESASQMQFIVVKEAIEELEKAMASEAIERLAIDGRIKVLEEARKRQIDINARLLASQETHKEPTKVPVKEEPTKFNWEDKFFWPWRK